jgi:hypothetical protein
MKKECPWCGGAIHIKIDDLFLGRIVVCPICFKRSVRYVPLNYSMLFALGSAGITVLLFRVGHPTILDNDSLVVEILYCSLIFVSYISAGMFFCKLKENVK